MCAGGRDYVSKLTTQHTAWYRLPLSCARTDNGSRSTLYSSPPMPSRLDAPSPKTRDRDVRTLVLTTVLSEHANDPETRIVQELGLEHGLCRVDIAVVNGCLHGFELKSDADNLLRLPRQVDAYSRSLDKATLVVGTEHYATAETMLPPWWGIKIVSTSPRGLLRLQTHRRARKNPDPSLFHMAHLMWRDEVIEVLRAHGASSRELSLNRAGLYSLFVEAFPANAVRESVREALKSRKNWRHPVQPS